MTAALPSKGLILITGPAWSGKTAYAIELLKAHKSTTWIGTAYIQDDSMREHVASIRTLRPTSWKTLDTPTELPDVIRAQSAEYAPLVIDSVSLWLGNLASKATNKYVEDQLLSYLCDGSDDFMDAIQLQLKHRLVVIVTAELGGGVSPDSPAAYALRRATGLLNQRLSPLASQVIQLCCGIGTILKDSSKK